MNLKIINHCIDQYYEIARFSGYDGWKLWELTHNFQNNWDVDTSDFKKMYIDCFTPNSPLWHRDQYYPKRAMEGYFDLHEDFIRSVFMDLFNENRDISGRISRFIYQCDELYKIDRSKTQKVLPHYHEGREMVHLYLGFRYPSQYSLYDFDSFHSFLNKVEVKTPFQHEDIERFVKVCRTLSTLIQKHESLVELVKDNVVHLSHGQVYPMLMVFELYSLVEEYE